MKIHSPDYVHPPPPDDSGVNLNLQWIQTPPRGGKISTENVNQYWKFFKQKNRSENKNR